MDNLIRRLTNDYLTKTLVARSCVRFHVEVGTWESPCMDIRKVSIREVLLGWDCTTVTCYVFFKNARISVTCYGCTRNMLRFLLRFFRKMCTFSKVDAKCWDFASTHSKLRSFCVGHIQAANH